MHCNWGDYWKPLGVIKTRLVRADKIHWEGLQKIPLWLCFVGFALTWMESRRTPQLYFHFISLIHVATHKLGVVISEWLLYRFKMTFAQMLVNSQQANCDWYKHTNVSYLCYRTVFCISSPNFTNGVVALCMQSSIFTPFINNYNKQFIFWLQIQAGFAGLIFGFLYVEISENFIKIIKL